jgi:hypothetical protein
MKIAHKGRRETFLLGTPNKAAAAARARDIYLSLLAKLEGEFGYVQGDSCDATAIQFR